MALRKSKVYKLIASGTRETMLKGMMEYLRSGKSPNTKDPETGGNLLHHIVDHSEKFRDPETLAAVYMLACKDVDIDAQDNYGDTCLHKVVRVNGAYRLLIAFMRVGIDTGIVNNDGLTAEDILLTQKPDGWQTNLHFYNKYKPGLWQALQASDPDRKLIERLLKSWCRVTSVKKGTVVNFKTLLQDDVKKTDIILLIEKYENSVELALALIGGVGMVVRMWVKQGILHNFDPNFTDVGYEQLLPQRSTSPQPLLLATWETNSLSAVDVLMELKADPNVLYSVNPAVIPPKPLYFHLLTCEFRPTDLKVIERIFRDCDFSLRNCDGQTILFELIGRSEPDSLVKFVLSKNINIGARDRLGRTAKDYAVENGRLTHARLIDEHLIKLIKSKNAESVEKLVIETYTHIHDIKDGSGKTAEEIAKKYSTRKVHEIVKLSGEIQKYIQRLFRSVDEGMIEDLQKLLSCRKYAAAKDKCGKTVLLKALLMRNKEMVMYLVQEFDFIVNICDNLGRSPSHYTYLFMDEPEVIDELEKHGADSQLTDVRGVKPIEYSRKLCGHQEYQKLIKQCEDLHLDIYIHQTHFESQFYSAIEQGDFESVERLVNDAKLHGDLSRYSNTVFDCIDNSKEDIAVFLLMSEFKIDIYKQYNSCDPSNPMCAMMECGHSMTSLQERARQMDCQRVVKLIDDLKQEKTRL